VNESFWNQPSWSQALTLTERLAALRATPTDRQYGTVDHDRAARRLQRWQAQSRLNKDLSFERRLALEGIREEELRQLLGKPAEAMEAGCSEHAGWVAELAAAITQSPAIEPLPLPAALRSTQWAGVLSAFAPLIDRGRRRVREGVQVLRASFSDAPFEPEAVEELLFASLAEGLANLLARTLALEVNVARLRGLLQGHTARERFESFAARLGDRTTLCTLLQAYPVLARQLTICIDCWATASLEFLQHLCADWQMIRDTYCPASDPGMLVGVDGGVGDSHRGKRSVLVLAFGSGFGLVYKPRSLAADRAFQELLAWINARTSGLRFRTLQVLDRGDHGWIEYIDAQPCATIAEVQRFYQRQGAYVALLYALEATDFHYENLIAAGEHPIPIDLEGLFQPRMDGKSLPEDDTVLRSGLLPGRVWAHADSDGIDYSGLGGVSGQLTPLEVPVLEGRGTDTLRFTRKRIAHIGGLNRPSLNGDDVDVLNFAEQISDGFAGMYQLLMCYRDELLAEDGPIARFAQVEVRFITAATWFYATLLVEGDHPDMLRDALERDRLFEVLWGRVANFPCVARLIPAERADLHNGDIPIFHTRPNSRDIWTSTGERIADFMLESSMVAVQRRMRQLDDDDLAHQLSVIRSALTHDLVYGSNTDSARPEAAPAELLAVSTV
jgi:type 2 lantibiotic biosynthesis protein LanM